MCNWMTGYAEPTDAPFVELKTYFGYAVDDLAATHGSAGQSMTLMDDSAQFFKLCANLCEECRQVERIS